MEILRLPGYLDSESTSPGSSSCPSSARAGIARLDHPRPDVIPTS
jgi:hypothetical protein